jgi:hypothetical protein
LKEEKAEDPDCRSATEERQNVFADDQLHFEQ